MRPVYVMVVASAVSLAALAGCFSGQYTQIGAQSHFDYPNSNIKALGPVKVMVPGQGRFGSPPLPTSDDEVKLYNAALAQVEGADLVVDYVKTWRLYGFMWWYWSELELEGTAADMEVGRQRLK